MDRSIMTRGYATRALSVCAVVLLAGSVAACANEEPTGDPELRSEPSASADGDVSADAGAAAGFCDSVEGIGDDLALLELTEFADPEQYPDRVAAAAERFATVEPPAEIATSWQHVNSLLEMTNDALQGVEVTSEEDLREALRFDSEEAFGMVIQLPGQIETVAVYVQETCQVDLGVTAPVIADVCAAIDTAHLESVFDGDIPEGENRRWGESSVECMWKSGGNEVGIVVMPAATMQSDLLSDKSPLESVQTGDAPTDVYDGAFGPLRAAAGRTATTVVGDTGVLASVRTGDDQADALKAIALAGLVAADLG